MSHYDHVPNQDDEDFIETQGADQTERSRILRVLCVISTLVIIGSVAAIVVLWIFLPSAVLCTSGHEAHFLIPNVTTHIELESHGNSYSVAFQALGYQNFTAHYILCRWTDLNTKSCDTIQTTTSLHTSNYNLLFPYDECGLVSKLTLDFLNVDPDIIIMLCIASNDVFQDKCFTKSAQPKVLNHKKRDAVHVSENLEDCKLSMKRAAAIDNFIDFEGKYIDDSTPFVFKSANFNITHGDSYRFCAQTWKNRNVSVAYSTCTTPDGSNATCSKDVPVVADYISGPIDVSKDADEKLSFTVNVTGISGMFIAAVGKSPYIDLICP